MMNAHAPRHVLRETLDVNDELLTVSRFSGIASTLDDPGPVLVTIRERAMASLGDPTDLKPHRGKPEPDLPPSPAALFRTETSTMARPTAAQKQARITAERAGTARDEQAWELRRISQAASATAPYDPLLTIEQVSDWLGVPKGTLYEWRSRHQGPRAIKVGGSLRYRRNEVDAYLDRRTDSRSA